MKQELTRKESKKQALEKGEPPGFKDWCQKLYLRKPQHTFLENDEDSYCLGGDATNGYTAKQLREFVDYFDAVHDTTPLIHADAFFALAERVSRLERRLAQPKEGRLKGGRL